MNAVINQKPEQDKLIQSQGLAALTFTLHWLDGSVEHENEMHVDKFSVWREADFLPVEIGASLSGCAPGILRRQGCLQVK